MKGARLLSGAALLALSAHTLTAQTAAPTPTRTPVLPILGVSVGASSLDAESAAASAVEDHAFGLQLDAGALIRHHFYLGIDVGGQFLKDNAQFSQNTTGGMKKSNASVTYFSAIAGLRSGMPNALPVALGLNVGASATVSRRSIDQCVDCQVDKLRIPGGVFVEPSLLVGRGNVKFRAVDRVYGSGGMRNVASVGVEVALVKKRR